MNSLVYELQHDALDRKVPTSDLLRKALVVARKLRVSELQEWITNELEGYEVGAEIPEYRTLRGTVKAWNPFHGWLPVTFEDLAIGEAATFRKIHQPIAPMEVLIHDDDDGMLSMPFSHEVGLKLMRSIDSDAPPVLEIYKSSLAGVLDAVRNVVLNWSFRLEEDGVLGEGLTFSSAEQEKAQEVPSNVAYFYGAVSHAQVQQGTSASTQVMHLNESELKTVRELAENLLQTLDRLGLTSTQQRELTAEGETILAQVASPKPKAQLIRGALTSIRAILESASGNVLAADFLHRFGHLFS